MCDESNYVPTDDGLLVIRTGAPTASASGLVVMRGRGAAPGSGGDARWDGLAALPGMLGYEGTPANVTTMNNVQVTYDSGKAAALITMGAGDRTSQQTDFELRSPEYVSVGGSNGTYLCTIDIWLDPSMREVPDGGNYNTFSGGVNWKTFNTLFDVSSDAGAITWEPWLNPGDGDASGIAHSGSRSYPELVTGQSNRQPYHPRGLASKVWHPTNALSVPYGQWVRFVILHELNLDETHFSDWNTATGTTLAAGTYHRNSQWVQIGSTVYCMYWRVPMSRVVGPSTRTHLQQWGVEFDTSHDPQVASGTIRFTGTDGSVVPANLFVYTGGGTRRYRLGGAVSNGTGTGQSATSTTFVLKASSSFADNSLVGKTLTIASGTGAGQTRVILSNTLADDTVVVDAWSTIPSGSGYAITETWTVTGGSVDVPATSSLAAGTPKTSGYHANVADGTVFTFAPASAPSGIDDASTAVGAFTGGMDVIESDAYVWFKHLAIIPNYSFSGSPETDTLIFANDLS